MISRELRKLKQVMIPFTFNIPNKSAKEHCFTIHSEVERKRR